MQALGVPVIDLDVLPPLPGNLCILKAALFCGDVIAISTKDGIEPDEPFILLESSSEWARLTVH